MADGDHAAIRIDVGGIVRQAMVARHRQALRSEGFVEFDDVHLREFEAGLFQHLPFLTFLLRRIINNVASVRFAMSSRKKQRNGRETANKFNLQRNSQREWRARTAGVECRVSQ